MRYRCGGLLSKKYDFDYVLAAVKLVFLSPKPIQLPQYFHTPNSRSMRFTQLDRITSLEKGKSIAAVRCLALSEEYLRDHFPRFPVMPGVLMLEAMFQASGWLVRASNDFAHSSVVLKETRSLKFQGFVAPGDSLAVEAEIKSVKEGSLYNLKVSGSINGELATSGRMIIDTYNLADREGVDPAIDAFMNHEKRLLFRRLCDPLDPNNPANIEKTPLY